MVKELFYKWFGLEPLPCPTCEVLKESLRTEQQFNKVLFEKLLEKDKPEPTVPVKQEELKPILPQHIPWRVRQQMLEAEDRQKAAILKQKTEEIDKLEKELIPEVREENAQGL